MFPLFLFFVFISRYEKPWDLAQPPSPSLNLSSWLPGQVELPWDLAQPPSPLLILLLLVTWTGGDPLGPSLTLSWLPGQVELSWDLIPHLSPP